MKRSFFKKLILCASAALALLVVAGCTRTPPTTDLTPDDYKAAARTCLDKMFADGVWDKFDGETAPTLQVSNIIDRTTCHAQTSWIANIIVGELNRNGKVKAMTTDQYSRETASLRKNWQSEHGDLDAFPTLPDVVLSGTIYEHVSRVGRLVTKTYRIEFELNSDGEKFGPYDYETTKERAY